MNSQRTRLGLAFGAVALGGIVLGFAVSARLDFTGQAGAREKNGPPSAVRSADFPPTKLTPPDAPPTPVAPLAPAPPVATSPGGPPSGSFAGLVKQIGPSVVFIGVEKFRAQGLGTGFIVSPDGYIVTNEHVVGQASKITVKLADGQEFPAQIVGTDPRTDLALIKIDAPSVLPAVTLGDSDALEVGEWVIAIGAPLGLDHTVTAGIVSAKQRRGINPGGRSSPYEDFIQTDASINPGNSGGPLINARGEVVGINSAVSTQGQGIGFAIPINIAKTLLPQLKNGPVERSWLGISIGQVDAQLAASYGLPSQNGTLVADVVKGGPSDKAGLHRGDVILSFDGKSIGRADDLPWLASTAGVGKTVVLDVAGPTGQRKVEVTLERMP